MLETSTFSVFLIILRPNAPGFATLSTFWSIYVRSGTELVSISCGVSPLRYEFIITPFEVGSTSFRLKNMFNRFPNWNFIGSLSTVIQPIQPSIALRLIIDPFDPVRAIACKQSAFDFIIMSIPSLKNAFDSFSLKYSSRWRPAGVISTLLMFCMTTSVADCIS